MDRIYIDTNVFLNPVLYDPSENQDARQALALLRDVVDGRVEAFTSTLTWDEFAWVTMKVMDIATSRQKAREFLVFPRLHFMDVTTAIIHEAQRLLEKHSIKPRDAIHLASALAARVDRFITLDDDFKDINEIRCEKP